MVPGDILKLPLVALVLASVAFAQYYASCPSGCECLSYAEFELKYGRVHTPSDYCEGKFAECGYDIRYGPKMCFKTPEPQPPEPVEPGTGECSAGDNSPGNHSWQPGGSDPWNEMLQLRVHVSATEGVELRTLLLQAFGTGDDSAGISAIEAYYDVDGDGSVGPGELRIGSVDPAYPADDGERALGLQLSIPADSVRRILIVYVMSPDAQPGTTYAFTAKDLQVRGQLSGERFSLGGLPLNSSIKTVVARPPECTASLALAIEPAVAEPGAPVTATASGFSNCTNRTAAMLAGPCGSGAPQACACTVAGPSCSCGFSAPSEPGIYAYHACADIGGSTQDAGPVSLAVEVPPECSSDSACADDMHCSGGDCVQVLGVCGYASNHAWTSYACGPEPGCQACPGGMSCENRSCVARPPPKPENTTNQTGAQPVRQPTLEDLARMFFRYISDNPAATTGLAAVIALVAAGVWIFRRRPPALPRPALPQ